MVIFVLDFGYYDENVCRRKKNGTIEILLTKPIRDISIISAKFLAGLTIVVLSVLPTMIYMICVYKLGSPVGNMDIGSALGSYIGLIFLGGVLFLLDFLLLL